MSSLLVLNPDRVTPLPGICLVQIDEVLGGLTEGGIFIPGDVAEAKGNKDTAHGIVLKLGPLPDLRHVTLAECGPEGFRRPGRTDRNHSGARWPGHAFPVQPGDRLYFPRDLPLVFVYEDRRYGFVNMDECLFYTQKDDTGHLQVMPSQSR